VRTHLLIPVLAVSLAAVPLPFAVAPVAAQSAELIREYPEEPRSSWRRLAWEADGGRPALEGLSVKEVAARGLVDRLLLLGRSGEGSAEARLISTVTVAPRSGEHEFFLQDDASGWWAELTLRYDHRWNGLRHYARTVGEVLQGMDTLGFDLETSDGIAVDGVVRPGEAGGVDELSLLAALDEIGVVARLGAAVPEDLHGPLAGLRRYWEANPSGTGVTHQTLVDLLAVVTDPDRDAVLRAARSRRADREGGLVNTLFKPVRGVVGLWDDLWHSDEGDGGGSASSWKQDEGPPEAGSTIGDPEVLAWLERFDNVPSPDPLADHRLSDVLPGRTP
jgi:hypothetical protein